MLITTYVLDLTCDTVAERARPVLERWPIGRAWLYGSVARGEQGPGSDVDISIELMEGGRLGLEIYHLQDELEEALGADVDVQTVPDRFMASQAFIEEYDRDRILIYERAQ